MRYEHVDPCEKFNETFLPPKEKFYSELNNENQIKTTDMSKKYKTSLKFRRISRSVQQNTSVTITRRC